MTDDIGSRAMNIAEAYLDVHETYLAMREHFPYEQPEVNGALIERCICNFL